jgi:hypothetical protein
MDYIKIYNKIIERAKYRVLEEYKEKHHIVPKCLGGNNNEENIVELTAREHFLCHILLCEIYPNNRDLWYALFLMSINKNKRKGQKYKVTSREYERIKTEWNKHSKGRKKPEGFGEKIRHEERNKKIGKANSKPKPKGFGENHSKKMKGKKKNLEFKKKLIDRNSKTILQYDKQMNFIKEWKNAVEASECLNINKCVINAVARQNGINHSAGGYIWRYKK